MKVSINRLKEFTDIKLSSQELVEKIGAQLGAVEEVVDFGKKYERILVVKVISCQQHPDADKLKLCLIDDGGITEDVKRDENGNIAVVCGAPNVQEGMLAAWLPPGSVVPATADKNPLVLESREIRGQISNGMLASSHELDLSADHSGILEIDTPADPGTRFTDLYNFSDDVVIDIENKMFTHRPDLFGALGIAREIAGIQQQPFKSPDWYVPSPVFPDEEAEELELEVRNEIPNLAPRFTAVAIREVEIKPSPIWLQIELAKVGLRPINNIVDLTNYYMILTAQPIHAYDYDKVKELSGHKAMLVIRNGQEDERLSLLSGKTIKPKNSDIVIGTDKQAIGFGGVMGGSETEVDPSTKNLIIECANFDMYAIRRTAMSHGLFTDAVTRFNKGQSPLQNLAVLVKIITDIKQIAGGKVASRLIDDNHISQESLQNGSLNAPVQVSSSFINSRLGLELTVEEIATLLRNVEFEIDVDDEQLGIKAPFWRTDIEIAEDVIEEVGRLYGYDKLPLYLPTRSLRPVGPDQSLELKRDLRQKLAGFGANEVLTYSFVNGALIDQADQTRDYAFRIANALSPDLQYYRLSLTPSLLAQVHPNVKAGFSKFAIFEIGKSHSNTAFDDEDLPREFDRLALVCTDNKESAGNGAAYFQAKAYVDVLTDLEILPYEEGLLNNFPMLLQLVAPFEPSRSALLWNGKMAVGIVGEYKASVARKLKLPMMSAGFEMFLSALKPSGGLKYRPRSAYPDVIQDICLQVSDDVAYQDLCAALEKGLTETIENDEKVILEPLDIYAAEELGGMKRITFRVKLTSYSRTLTVEVLSRYLENVAEQLHTAFGATRI